MSGTARPEANPRMAEHVHPAEAREWYEHVLTGSEVRRHGLQLGQQGERVHVLETGAGPPLVLLHGSGAAAGLFLPLLDELEEMRVLAPDRAGSGLSDPIDVPRGRWESVMLDWIGRVLDALELETTSLLGHSAGGVLALRYALACPERVERLVLVGPPTLPGTRCPLPYRVLATPALGDLVARIPPSRKSVLRFAEFMGERATLAERPDLVDMFLVAGRDPLAAEAVQTEVRSLVSPFALLTRSGWPRESRVDDDALRRLATPTLLVWGEREPLGSVSVAQEIVDLIPNGRLCTLPAGHAPWLGQPEQTAAAIATFVLSGSAQPAQPIQSR